MRTVIRNHSCTVKPEDVGFVCGECLKTWEEWDDVWVDPCRCHLATMEESRRAYREGHSKSADEVLEELWKESA